MSEPNTKMPPKINLQEIKRRLEKSEELVVDATGQIHLPEEPDIANTPLPNKTVVKPTRWF
jgi:hypothetical protein